MLAHLLLLPGAQPKLQLGTGASEFLEVQLVSARTVLHVKVEALGR